MRARPSGRTRRSATPQSVHNAEVHERGLVGMGATVLDRSVVGKRAMVGADSLVTEDTEIEPETL